MPQPKGTSGNPNGRPKGTPNKTTKELREWINDFINANTEQIEKDFKALEPIQRITIFEKLLKFVLPAKQENTVNMDEERAAFRSLFPTEEQLEEARKNMDYPKLKAK